MNELQNFPHDMFGNLGILIKDGKEFFPATDVAKTLGYSNPHKAIKDHCKSEGVNETLVPTNGGAQTKKFINEGNLYRLIVKSKLPQAEQFERWVFDKVLPSIRKNGAYMTENTLEKALTSPDFLIELATNLKHEQEARKLVSGIKGCRTTRKHRRFYMNELQVFNNDELGQVRTVMKDGEHWFIAKDVCDILDIKNPRTSKALLDDDEKGVHTMDTLGGSQEFAVINESGLYSLVLKSRKPQAKSFKKWITSEALPMIRKTGGYVNNDEMFVNTYLAHADEMTKTLFKSTLETVRKQNEKIAVLESKAEYHDNVLDSTNSFTITEIAHDLNNSQHETNI